MTAGPLARPFFERATVDVARALLGCHLVREVDGHFLRGRIVETEAYVGREDTACHAHKGRTARTEVMFGPAGHSYVYFVYGLHHLCNIVTEGAGFPAAVLLRAVEPLEGLEFMQQRRGGEQLDRALTNGPAKLCQAFGIGLSLNKLDVTRGQQLWLEAGAPPADREIAAGPRIGIGYAARKDRLAPWRFWLKNNPFVSR
ncbi:MAG: DNA-3-methyladenine glycosylase [Anaerolineae bacterium]